MKKIGLRIYHFYMRIYKGVKYFPQKCRNFGFKVACISFVDSLFPPEKKPIYIQTVENYVDKFTKNLVEKFDENALDTIKNQNKKSDSLWNVWCCWWQGEEMMPELVKLCNQQLKKMISNQNVKLNILTLDNYKEFVTISQDIIDKFEENKITMTEMSDILRVNLLYEYGGLWLDSTVFLTKPLDKHFISSIFYSQRMYDPDKWKYEACKGRWSGFIVSGCQYNPIFKYLNDCFIEWWRMYDCVIDYVIYDYFLLSLYKSKDSVKNIIDSMENNNEDVFEMYKHLNDIYSLELWDKLNKTTSMHKLTYKISLYKQINGYKTLYGHLVENIFGDMNNE